MKNHWTSFSDIFPKSGCIKMGNSMYQVRSFKSLNCKPCNTLYSTANSKYVITENRYKHNSGYYQVKGISEYECNVCDNNGPKSILMKIV